jgi:uncharacterized protein
MMAKDYPFQRLIALAYSTRVLTHPGRADTLARLMSGLPPFFEPIRLAERGETIAGDLAVSQMPRLRLSLHDASGTVHLRLDCTPAESGAIRIHGRLTTTLNMECQRCLAAFELPLDLSVDAVAAIEGGPAAETADVLMRGERHEVHLGDFVEDELILAVPLAPLHPAGQCPVAEYRAAGKERRDSPFAVLESLRSKKD